MFLRVSRSNASLVESLLPLERVFALEVMYKHCSTRTGTKAENRNETVNKA